MAIKITQADGSELTFDTVEEFEAVTKMQEEAEDGGEKIAREIQEELHGDYVKRVETSFVKLSEEAGVDTGYVYEYATDEPPIKAGDKVRIIGNRGIGHPPDTILHNYEIGDVGVVIKTYSGGAVLVAVKGSDYASQTISPEHVELVEEGVPIAKDANGEDLYEGDLVTGINDDEYYFTDSKALMEVAEDGNPHRDGEIKVSVVKHVNEKFDGLPAIVNPEYFVKTTEEECYKTHNPVIEVGSKVIALKGGCDITEGVVYTVDRIDTDGDYSFMDDETETNYFNHEDNGTTFRPATDEEIADAERNDTEPKFKDGDKVRVVGNSNPVTHSRHIGCEGVVVLDMPIKYGLGVHAYEFYPEDTSLANQTIGEADLELIADSRDFQAGDIVMVDEEFTDITGDVAEEGLAEVFVGVTGNRYVIQAEAHVLGRRVLTSPSYGSEGNEDKLTLVCRAEDRLDAEKF